MRTYTVFWFYVGNHGAYRREANSPEEACRQVIRGFSDDFAERVELVAVEGDHRMRPGKAYGKHLERLAVQGCTLTLGDGRHGVVLSREVTKHDKTFLGRMDDDEEARIIKLADVAEFLPADGPCCASGGQIKRRRIGDRVLLPKGTSIIVGSQERETSRDTLATVTSVHHPLALLTVDDIEALPDIQHEWNRSEGKPVGNTEVELSDLKEIA